MIYSYFTNEYTLTEDMCAETETSRMDLGIACVFVAAAAILAANLWPSLELIPEIPGLLYEYFSSPPPPATFYSFQVLIWPYPLYQSPPFYAPQYF